MRHINRLTLGIIVLLALLISTVGYAAENAERAANTYSFVANYDNQNQIFQSTAALRWGATEACAAITPDSQTGQYHLLRLHVKYLGNNTEAAGTKCTDYKYYTSSQFTIPYTSNCFTDAFYKLCGESNYGLFTASGRWAP